MANYSQAAPEGPAAPSRNLATFANWIGAAVSLVLVAGVGVWGYQLLMRDLSGIPVVRAAEGPMRVAPDDPGGSLADHQGLAVNDVAGTGVAAAPAEQVLLAPRPVGLSAEDMPILARAERASEDVARPGAAETPQSEELPFSIPDLENAEDPIQALADQIAAGIAPLSDLDPVDEAETETAAAEPDAVPLTGPGLQRSLRPQGRPDGLQTASLGPVVVAPAGPTEIDVADLAPGTRLVQLGAFDSADMARTAWTRLEARFEEYLGNKDRVVQQASSGGRTFYRLRAHGFDDLSDARRFCAALVAENVDCIPVEFR